MLLLLCLVLSAPAIAQNKWILVQGGTWVPSMELLSDLKVQLQPYVMNESKNQRNPITDFHDYSYQLQGQEENGNEFIFINAFCETPKEWSLDKEMLIVFDGGKCYFTLKYDKNKRVFYQLIINGEAYERTGT